MALHAAITSIQIAVHEAMSGVVSPDGSPRFFQSNLELHGEAKYAPMFLVKVGPVANTRPEITHVLSMIHGVNSLGGAFAP